MSDTTHDAANKILLDHIEDCNKRITHFNSIKHDNNRVPLLYEDFKFFLGSFDYLSSCTSTAMVRKLLRDMVHELAADLFQCMKHENDIKARYLMEKFMALSTKMVGNIEKYMDGKLVDADDTGPTITVKIEASAPVFACYQCDLNKKYEEKRGKGSKHDGIY